MQTIDIATETKLSSKNQMVVPRKIREALKLKKGDKVLWRIRKDKKNVVAEVSLRPRSWTKYMAGLGKKTWQGVDVDKYISNLRDEWER